MNQNTFYTSQNLWDLTCVNPDLLLNILMKKEADSSANEFFSIPANTAPLIWWHLEKTSLPIVAPESIQDNFIGMLSIEDAKEMRNEFKLFKKRFDEDLNKRNKILFRE